MAAIVCPRIFWDQQTGHFLNKEGEPIIVLYNFHLCTFLFSNPSASFLSCFCLRLYRNSVTQKTVMGSNMLHHLSQMLKHQKACRIATGVASMITVVTHILVVDCFPPKSPCCAGRMFHWTPRITRLKMWLSSAPVVIKRHNWGWWNDSLLKGSAAAYFY